MNRLRIRPSSVLFALVLFLITLVLCWAATTKGASFQGYQYASKADDAHWPTLPFNPKPWLDTWTNEAGLIIIDDVTTEFVERSAYRLLTSEAPEAPGGDGTNEVLVVTESGYHLTVTGLRIHEPAYRC